MSLYQPSLNWACSAFCALALLLVLAPVSLALTILPNTNEPPSEQLKRAAQVKVYAAQAKSIVLPGLKFRDAPLDEVFAELADLSIEHDPDGHGISFIVNLNAEEPMPRVTLSMGKTSVLRAVNLITKAADVAYRIDASAIVIRSLKSNEKAG